MHFITLSTHFVANLIQIIIALKKFYSTLSYDLLMSNFIAISPFFPYLLCLSVLRISYAINTLFEINRLGIKALCTSSIHFPITLRKWFAITFANILYKTLYKLIRRKCDIFIGLELFRNKHNISGI